VTEITKTLLTQMKFNSTMSVPMKITDIEYKYNEGELLKEFSQYIDKTYDQHYSLNKYQSTEFIIDSGHGEGFCIGNILKYAQRYGKKNGKNRADILKVMHYALFMLHVHDREIIMEKVKNEVI
jgi:hypothetical protein